MNRRNSESGFTLVAAVCGSTLIALLATVAVATVNGDVHFTQNDLAHKQAYEAARAGINEYFYHLNSENNYWSHCTEVAEPNAVNQQGSTAKQRNVPEARVPSMRSN